jgi:hypothetical protein
MALPTSSPLPIVVWLACCGDDSESPEPSLVVAGVVRLARGRLEAACSLPSSPEPLLTSNRSANFALDSYMILIYRYRRIDVNSSLRRDRRSSLQRRGSSLLRKRCAMSEFDCCTAPSVRDRSANGRQGASLRGLYAV